ncbi:MAG: tetratricopeptide repeat protein, partial [Bdellovibrionales bacterium]|nr:tetratricopeptide repeat protein [Bdellovibrionales bacterium]
LTSIRRRVPPPPIVPVLALESDEVLATKLPAEISRLFTNALLRIREGNFAEALPLLSEAEGLSVGRDWAPILVFWSGVAEDGLADLKRALATYHRMVQEYPQHPRSALALLRQASVFVRLHDTDTARLTLRKLLQEFPGTSEAAQAKERLKKLS